jgi:hypothetical protein
MASRPRIPAWLLLLLCPLAASAMDVPHQGPQLNEQAVLAWLHKHGPAGGPYKINWDAECTFLSGGGGGHAKVLCRITELPGVVINASSEADAYDDHVGEIGEMERMRSGGVPVVPFFSKEAGKPIHLNCAEEETQKPCLAYFMAFLDTGDGGDYAEADTKADAKKQQNGGFIGTRFSGALLKLRARHQGHENQLQLALANLGSDLQLIRTFDLRSLENQERVIIDLQFFLHLPSGHLFVFDPFRDDREKENEAEREMGRLGTLIRLAGGGDNQDQQRGRSDSRTPPGSRSNSGNSGSPPPKAQRSPRDRNDSPPNKRRRLEEKGSTVTEQPPSHLRTLPVLDVQESGVCLYTPPPIKPLVGKLVPPPCQRRAPQQLVSGVQFLRFQNGVNLVAVTFAPGVSAAAVADLILGGGASFGCPQISGEILRAQVSEVSEKVLLLQVAFGKQSGKPVPPWSIEFY